MARTGGRERRRVPQPLFKYRLASGRGATEQPNAGSDGDAALTPKFWIAVVITGVASGLFGIALLALLFAFARLAFGSQAMGFQASVENSSGVRRVGSLLIAGAFGGVAWYLLRRYTRGERTDVDDSVWTGTGELSFRRSLGTGVISQIVIGLGASLGREAAPKLLGGVSGTVVSGWMGLTPAQRRLLVSCGAGAGFAAVYNVPLGGALFTAELLMGSLTLPVVLPALACSGLATLVSWWYLPTLPTYVNIPSYHTNAPLMVWSLLVGPLIAGFAAGYIRVIGWVSHHRAQGRAVLFAPLLAFGVLGLISLAYPELLGNGRAIARNAFQGNWGLTLLLALFLLKPFVTALCLASGAAGGLFTPVLSTGAVMGGFLGIAWSHLWPGAPSGAYAMVAASAMIGAAMQAPLTGLVLVLELTHTGFQLVVPMIAATVIATAITRYVDGYSIYSARLPVAEAISS